MLQFNVVEGLACAWSFFCSIVQTPKGSCLFGVARGRDGTTPGARPSILNVPPKQTVAPERKILFCSRRVLSKPRWGRSVLIKTIGRKINYYHFFKIFYVLLLFLLLFVIIILSQSEKFKLKVRNWIIRAGKVRNSNIKVRTKIYLYLN